MSLSENFWLAYATAQNPTPLPLQQHSVAHLQNEEEDDSGDDGHQPDAPDDEDVDNDDDDEEVDESDITTTTNTNAVDDSPQQAAGDAKTQQQQFPNRLHAILENAESKGYSNIISWIEPKTLSSSSSTTTPTNRFRVHNRMKFIQHIASKHFKQSKYKSFSRQLNMWGFIRIQSGYDRGSYEHLLFQKGRPELCQLMNRQKPPPPLQPSSSSSSPSSSNNGVVVATTSSKMSINLLEEGKEKQLLEKKKQQNKKTKKKQQVGTTTSTAAAAAAAATTKKVVINKAKRGCPTKNESSTPTTTTTTNKRQKIQPRLPVFMENDTHINPQSFSPPSLRLPPTGEVTIEARLPHNLLNDNVQHHHGEESLLQQQQRLQLQLQNTIVSRSSSSSSSSNYFSRCEPNPILHVAQPLPVRTTTKQRQQQCASNKSNNFGINATAATSFRSIQSSSSSGRGDPFEPRPIETMMRGGGDGSRAHRDGSPSSSFSALLDVYSWFPSFVSSSSIR